MFLVSISTSVLDLYHHSFVHFDSQLRSELTKNFSSWYLKDIDQEFKRFISLVFVYLSIDYTLAEPEPDLSYSIRPEP